MALFAQRERKDDHELGEKQPYVSLSEVMMTSGGGKAKEREDKVSCTGQDVLIVVYDRFVSTVGREMIPGS